MTSSAHTTAPTDAHQALFYRDSDEYLDGISEFIEPALERDEPVAIAVPAPKIELLRKRLGRRAARIEMLDMFELGRNPGRIIPAVQLMIERHGTRALHYVGEPIWPGRSPDEVREATRHEALINLAWPDAGIRVLCPYDATSLDDHVLEDAHRTHPGVVHGGRLNPSSTYHGPSVPPECDRPLSDPPPDEHARTFEIGDLRRLRTWVAERAAEAGMDDERRGELVIAVNELATNTVKHAHSHGVLRCWRTPAEVIFQIEDAGYIADPLAGRRRRPPGMGGLGLWMVNELCDLVEIRTGAAGTAIRVHSRIARSPRETLGRGHGFAAQAIPYR